MQLIGYRKTLYLTHPQKEAIGSPAGGSKGPCVTVIMPFEPKMLSASTLREQVQKAISIVEAELLQTETADTTELILLKLKAVATSLDYATYTKSIAIFLSTDYEKVYYLEVAVEMKIIVNSSFNIRDIILNKLPQQEFLLLLISKKNEKLFLCNNQTWQLLVSNSNNNNYRKIHASAENTRLQTKSFIKKVDAGLSIILKAYPLPLFVACSKTLMKEIIQHSRNSDNILEFIPVKNTDGIGADTCINRYLQSYIRDWQKTRERYLLRQLKKEKCFDGIKDVRKAVGEKRGKLLLVEKDFTYPSFTRRTQDAYAAGIKHKKNKVDAAMQSVLENGGDVELVSNGVLSDYRNIVLI